MNTADNPIEAFLDAADSVLNSNTFLIRTDLGNEDLREHLTRFIASEAFLDRMLSEDIDRGWFNLHTFLDSDIPIPRPGKLAKTGFRLTLTKTATTAREYLEGLLCGDLSKGNFRSFYGRQKTPAEARSLAANLIAYIGKGQECSLYILAPDFLYDAGNDEQELYYFEGAHGACDTAAVLVSQGSAYVLLTNGAP